MAAGAGVDAGRSMVQREAVLRGKPRGGVRLWLSLIWPLTARHPRKGRLNTGLQRQPSNWR
jgi:hypothetical protein